VPATASEIVVHMDGGDARVRFTDQGEAILTGPADYVGSVRWEMTQGE
jgi:diaminopimelate epimerase